MGYTLVDIFHNVHFKLFFLFSSNIANGRSQNSSQQNWPSSTDGNISPAPVQSRSFKVLQKITDTNPIEGNIPCSLIIKNIT